MYSRLNSHTLTLTEPNYQQIVLKLANEIY